MTTGKTCSEEEIYLSGDPIPERYEYRPVNEREYWVEEIGIKDVKGEIVDCRFALTSPDGTVLGGKYWKDIPWRIRRFEALEGYFVFYNTSVTEVMDENDLYGIINRNGEMVLPAEYESIECIGSFSDLPDENGCCLLALKDNVRYVFDLKGNLLFSVLLAESGPAEEGTP